MLSIALIINSLLMSIKIIHLVDFIKLSRMKMVMILILILVVFLVYCDMETDEGGWILIASIADDNNNYWYNFVC